MPRGGPFDDPFFNNLFNDPAFAPSMPKEVHLKSEAATLEVKPLPPNPPVEFSGAVGTFIMKVDANPKNAQVGDPDHRHGHDHRPREFRSRHRARALRTRTAGTSIRLPTTSNRTTMSGSAGRKPSRWC